MPIDPASVTTPRELAALSSEDRIRFSRLFPEAFAEVSGSPPRIQGGPLTADEAKEREAGLAKAAKADEKRLAGATTYGAFMALPSRLQMKLHREDPQRYATLSRAMRAQVSRGSRP